MIGLLAKWFIPNSGALDAPGVRGAYGTLCGAVGIALNALLFLGKLLAGSLSGSIAVTADAFNNLSDAGSSLITLIGFRMAGRKPDPQHPFGHGRIEYISGFIVALAILLMGFELLTGSIEKIAAPEPVAFSRCRPASSWRRSLSSSTWPFTTAASARRSIPPPCAPRRRTA